MCEGEAEWMCMLVDIGGGGEIVFLFVMSMKGIVRFVCVSIYQGMRV